MNFDNDNDSESLEKQDAEQKDSFDEEEDKKIDEEILRLINKKQDCQILKQKLLEARLLNESMDTLLNS